MILVKLSDEEIRAIKNDIYDLAFDVEMSTEMCIRNRFRQVLNLL